MRTLDQDQECQTEFFGVMYPMVFDDGRWSLISFPTHDAESSHSLVLLFESCSKNCSGMKAERSGSSKEQGVASRSLHRRPSGSSGAGIK